MCHVVPGSVVDGRQGWAFGASVKTPGVLSRVVYVTVEGFVAIGCITGIECIFGRARWLKTRRTGLLSRARPMS